MNRKQKQKGYECSQYRTYGKTRCKCHEIKESDMLIHLKEFLKFTKQKYIDTYAMYGVTIDCYNKTIPTTTLLDELRSNNPVDLHVSDLRNTSLAHAILLYGLNVYNDHTDYYILDPDFSSAYGKATVTTYGLPNESHKNFVYKTTYENRAESRQHEYKWKYTRY